jgi:uncharacterized protein (TIGR02145 family)
MKLFTIIIVTSMILISCKSSFVDKRDGHRYKTIRIGKQVWMAENFALKAESGCWAYNDSVELVKEFGYLYNLETAQKLAPSGWRLPTKEDFEILKTKVCGDDPSEKNYTNKLFYRLTARQDDGYLLPNFAKWQKSGFNARLAGYTSKISDAAKRDFSGMNTSKGFGRSGSANFWCTDGIFQISTGFFGSSVMITISSPENGYSVRYLKK